MNKFHFIVLISLLLISPALVFGQGQTLSRNELAGQVRIVSPAVPFLNITPDARGGALGELGAATSPDENSIHWNPAKLAFIDKEFGGTFSYTPWLRKLVNDINLSYLSIFKRIDEKQTIGGSLRYFSLGSVNFTDETGRDLTVFKPNEFALDFAYALKLSENLSGGVALRYIYSNLTGGISTSSGSGDHPGQTIAADFSFYYTGNEFDLFGKKTNINAGMNVSNLGSKISYSDVKQFIPANFKIGSVINTKLDSYNEFAFGIDLNKLLIPTPPYIDENGKVYGKVSDKTSVSSGIMQSFSDAPGGFSEELHEITVSTGLEYTYAKQFALRTGYFYEHETKGNRKYFTVGMGLKFSFLGLNFSYLIPINQNNPLEDTVRFTLFMNFGGLKGKKTNTTDEQ